MKWWRAHHGMVPDPRLRIVARKAGTEAGQVFAVWLALHEHASMAKSRGDVSGFDIEATAEAFGWDDALIASVVDALTARRMIVDGRIADWDEKQPEKVDRTGAKRQREWRERQKARKQADGARTKRPGSAETVTEHNGVTGDGDAVTSRVTPPRGDTECISDTLSQERDVTLKSDTLRTARELDRGEIWQALESSGIPANMIARGFNRATISTWIDSELTGHQLGEAIRRAHMKRRRDNDSRPINVGLIDRIIQDVRTGKPAPTNTRSNANGDELSHQFANG